MEADTRSNCRFSPVARRAALATAMLIAGTSMSACGARPTGPGVVAVQPDPSRTGADGLDGPRAAALVTVRVQARVTESFTTDVVFPALADGTLDRSGAPYPTVVFIHGGAVPAVRYQWMARHFATRGYVVVMPSHALNLAIFETDNAVLALRVVREAASDTGGTLSGAIATNGPVVAMGHSLGGVIAVRNWINVGFDGVALLASFPAPGDPVQQRAGSAVLSLVGSEDRRALPADVRSNFEPFAQPRLLGVVDGMNHYDWTDDATMGELATDGVSTRPLTASRQDAFRLIDTWLDAVLRRDATAQQRLDAGAFAGVMVSR